MPGVVQRDEDDDFLSSILDGLDESFFSSPSLTPARKPREVPSPAKARVSSCVGKRCRGQCGSNQASTSYKPDVYHSRQLSDSVDPHGAELRAIEDLIRADGDLFFDSDTNSSPTPKRTKKAASNKPRQPLTELVNGVEAGVRYVSRKERYIRCRIEAIDHETYIPKRYLDAPDGYHTTRGVKAETIRCAMERKQVVLHLTRLYRKGERDAPLEAGRRAVLRDDWIRTPVRVGDIIHLIGSWSARTDASPKRIEVAIEGAWEDPSPASATMYLSSDTGLHPRTGRSESENMLVLHPDTLLSATAISSAVISCARKAVLQARVKPSGPGADDKPTEALIMGRMLHEVLQSCLTGMPTKGQIIDRETYGALLGRTSFQEPSTFPATWHGPVATDFSDGYVKQQIISQVFHSLEDILHVGLKTDDVVEKLWGATLPFGSFAGAYLQGEQARSETSEKAEALDARSAISPLVRVVEVHDVEEDIWSAMYGLKGFIDVSVEVELQERLPDGKAGHSHTAMMPLELKTGRSINIAEHRAQTMLYSLMMSDRYSRRVDCGLLYYSKSAEMHLVRSVHHEVRGLMQARNELASYMVPDKAVTENGEQAITRTCLPPTIDDPRTCSRCYVAETCMLYRRAVDGIDDEEDALQGVEASPISDLSEKHTMHLTPRHLSFFRQWEQTLSFEESDVAHNRREMWTMTAAAREAKGRCYARMVLGENMTQSVVSGLEVKQTSNMNQCHVYRFFRAAREGPKGDDNHTLLGGNFAVGDAICLSIEPAMLSIAQGFLLDLSPDALVVGVDKRLEPILKRAAVSRHSLFRIDREEQVSGMARTRYNLAKLFFAPPAGDARRRELIVDLRKPEFRDEDKAVKAEWMDGLNDDQKAAINKVFSARDYALIVGMPGTGKTTTIARLIGLLARIGKSVLLTSYTHSAVDTICRKLAGQSDVRLLRLGSRDRIHADVQPFMLRQAHSAEHLHEQVTAPNVVATTSLSIGHVLFGIRSFDVCIVDEASQITLPACIGPLRYADKFVLVGDPRQLPPLVRDPRARNGGLDVSLFERLQRAHPSSVAQLCQQYRMNEDIMALGNTLTYDGALRCGDVHVARSSIEVKDVGAALSFVHVGQTACPRQTCWLARAVEPNNRALFLNTDGMQAFERRSGELVENVNEADLVVQLVRTLVRAGVDTAEIAIITPYRQQIRRLTQLFAQHTDLDLALVEVWTADKSQGRDKDVIIVSFVRSLEEDPDAVSSSFSGVGQLLHDVRRINVSLTRARKKLILIGSRQTLVRIPLLSRLWTFMHQRGWTYSPSLHQRDDHL